MSAVPTDRGELRRLLHAIFTGGEAAALFVVLRNGEALPEALSGNDLDVSVVDGVVPDDVMHFVVARASPLGWVPLCVSRRAHMTGFSLARAAAGSAPLALHFDVFDGITALGMRLISSALLAGESRTRRGVRELSPRAAVLATVVHHIASSGGLTKPKYADQLSLLLRDAHDGAWVRREVARALGPRIAAQLAGPDGGVGAIREPSPRRRLEALAAALTRGASGHPLTNLRAVARYARGQLPSLVQPPGIVGRVGERLAHSPAMWLDPELACRIAPLAMVAPHVRAPAWEIWTANSPKHQRCVRTLWNRAAVVRWVAPLLFLWVQAKRNRIVVLGELPLSARVLRAIARPRWLTAPETTR